RTVACGGVSVVRAVGLACGTVCVCVSTIRPLFPVLHSKVRRKIPLFHQVKVQRWNLQLLVLHPNSFPSPSVVSFLSLSFSLSLSLSVSLSLALSLFPSR